MLITLFLAFWLHFADIPQTRWVNAEEKVVWDRTSNSDLIVEVNPDTLTPSPIQIKPSPTPKQLPTGIPENLTPQRVIIDAIGISVPVIAEGKTPDGRMDVPPDNHTVGWWKYGAYPGEIGSAVFAGHFKMDDGSPGVFFNLRDVNVGDEITVILKDATKRVFIVTDKAEYTPNDFPMSRVFDNKDFRSLNFITCAGRYIKKLDDYSHRLVIYSKLIKI